ncbi:MAG: class I SAM-dependent methyltransferase [Gemmataceae bacterium]
MSEMEHWDNRYHIGDTPWDTGHPSAELMRVLEEDKIAPCPAIDLGCGTGSNAICLAERGFDVTALDISPTALDQGRCKKAKAGVKTRFVLGDVLNPPEDIGGPYGFVFDRGCYHVVRRINVEPFMQTLERITQKGSMGLFLAGNAKEKREKGPPTVSEEELRAELGKLFDIIRLREFRFDPIPGMDFEPLGWSCLMQRK